MTTLNNWQTTYKELLDFIAAHPQISIDKSSISIPRDVRDEFYQRFDAIRKAFVNDKYSALPSEVEILSEQYKRAEKEVRELLRLDRIAMPIDLLNFLQSPRDGLMRAIYNSLFDLLQGKITLDAFEQQATRELQESTRDLFRLGYEFWVALVVIKLLEPDKIYRVDLDPDEKAVLSELKEISFGRQAHHATIRLPEFVIHSRGINKYLAIKMGLAREIETYVAFQYGPLRRKRVTGDSSYALDSRVMLICSMAGSEEIPIIADLEKRSVAKPDLVIECAGQTELEDSAAFNQVKYRTDTLQPTFGTYLVSRDAIQQMTLLEPHDNIHPIAVGFDPSKLQSLVDKLAV